jgi:F-type H+-transporting ATPase subunit b
MANPVNTGTEVPHDAAHSAVFPPLDDTTFAPQLIWLAITFGALYLLLSRIALPRIGEVIEERRERVQRDLDSAERLKAETEKALASYEEALADARANANNIAKETRERLAQRVETKQKQVDSDIDAKVAEAEKRIDQTRAKALSSVDEIASGVVGDLVANLVGTSPSAEEVKAAIAAQSGK